MMGNNYVEFMRKLRYSYFVYVAGEEICDERISNISTLEDKGHKICLCKVKKKDFKWFKSIMDKSYKEEDKDFCEEVLGAVLWKDIMRLLNEREV